MSWGEKVTAKVLRPNVECTNGIIHLVDHVFIDDAPPWTVGGAGRVADDHWAMRVALAAVAVVTARIAN